VYQARKRVLKQREKGAVKHACAGLNQEACSALGQLHLLAFGAATLRTKPPPPSRGFCLVELLVWHR
jgi:hypothetical protein